MDAEKIDNILYVVFGGDISCLYKTACLSPGCGGQTLYWEKPNLPGNPAKPDSANLT